MPMSPSERRVARAGLLARRLVIAAACAAAPACDRPEGQRLVVASSWPAEARAAVESEFQRWLAAAGPDRSNRPLRLEWLRLEPGDDLIRLASRRNPPDVLLGGWSSEYRALASAGRLAPSAGEGSALWLVARRSVVRLAQRSGWARLPDRSQPGAASFTRPEDVANRSASPILVFNDPRVDPVSLCWAESLLRERGFRDGYARLIRAAALARAPGRLPGSASGTLARGEAELAPFLSPENPSGVDTEADTALPLGAGGGGAFALPARVVHADLEAARPCRWVEGAAVVRDAPHAALARIFMRFLAETQTMTTAAQDDPADTDDETVAGARGLLADLLGATLVDAHDELCRAWDALERAGFAPKALEWMTEPPPWPPASVTKLQAQRDANAAGLMETLASEIAPAPSVRADLLRCWLTSARPIELSLLSELARAAEGRLCGEPRFRAWLKAEWTAWARQRYRRVARLADAPAIRHPAAAQGSLWRAGPWFILHPSSFILLSRAP
jgi:hypothetical protein